MHGALRTVSPRQEQLATGEIDDHVDDPMFVMFTASGEAMALATAAEAGRAGDENAASTTAGGAGARRHPTMEPKRNRKIKLRIWRRIRAETRDLTGAPAVCKTPGFGSCGTR